MMSSGPPITQTPTRPWALLTLAWLLAGFNQTNRFPTLRNDFDTSGVVEGLYGRVYSFEERRSLFLFTARAGLNTYIYAPKGDPFHRARWRDPYPPEHLAHFQDLVELGGSIGVRFVYAISPGLTYDPDSGDFGALTQKLDTLLAIGVRDFCVLFDDIFGARAGADPEVQADVVSDTFDFLKSRDPETSLCFISQFYEGTVEQLKADSTRLSVMYPSFSSSAAYEAYERIPREVAIMWTGPAVLSSRLTVADASDFRSFVGRPVFVWDNYSVNDTFMSNDLFLAPYRGREPGLDEVIEGIVVNPMLQPEATKIPLWTVGRAFSLKEDYDPPVAWSEALMVAARRGRAGVRPLMRLAEHFQSHPVMDDQPESPELAAAASDFFDGRSPRSTRALRRLFRRYARNHRRLERRLALPGSNPALLSELADASRKLSLLGDAGILALKLLKQAEKGKPVDVRSLQDALAVANESAWLVGSNELPEAVALLTADRFPPNNRDVFGDFFAQVLTELAGK